MKKPNKYVTSEVAKFLLITIGALALSYFLTALVFYGFCKCFDLDIWSYKSSFWLWLAITLIGGIRINIEK